MRSIPSKNALYLPAHYSKELTPFQDSEERPTKNYWKLEVLINFIFPKSSMPKYYEIALSFLSLILKEVYLSSGEIGRFVKSRGISKATFYNRVLPKLKAFGLIRVERIPATGGKKGRMRVTLSKTFSNYLRKIADSWEALVDEAKFSFKQRKEE